jgi:[acyl-carrier-protein] S-malonyltransferase
MSGIGTPQWSELRKIFRLGFTGGSITAFPFMAIALLFSGQGAQKVGMGKSLYDNFATARSLYEEAGRVLGWDLAKVCFEGPEAELTQTRVCQPALFVHGLVLHAILREQGKLDDVKFALGLSLGEITALTAAGVFDFATGLRVVAERGRLMQLACEQSVGGMAAIIGEERAKVADLCKDFDIETANFNAPGQIIVSGEKPKVEAAVAAAKERGIKKVIPLNVAGAYHSRLMEPARVAFAEFLLGVSFAAPRLTVFTNTTGQVVSESGDIRAALVKQIVSSVLWEDCMRGTAAAGATEFWELGPGGVLAGLARRTEKTWLVRSFAEFSELAD